MELIRDDYIVRSIERTGYPSWMLENPNCMDDDYEDFDYYRDPYEDRYQD